LIAGFNPPVVWKRSQIRFVAFRLAEGGLISVFKRYNPCVNICSPCQPGCDDTNVPDGCFSFQFFCEAFKLVPVDSRRHKKTMDVTLGRQRHPDNNRPDKAGGVGQNSTWIDGTQMA